MKPNGTVTFRLPFWAMALLIVAFLPGLLTTGLQSAESVLLEAGVLVLVAAVIFKTYTIQIRPDGVRLYSLWWLPWENVVGAKYRRLCGLPHLYVQRKSGWVPWRIPLYFIGDTDFLETLRESSPVDSPIRAVSVPASP